MPHRRFLILSVAGLLTGCALPGTLTFPTAYPADYVPTVIYLTAQSINAATMAALPPTPEPTATSMQIPATLAPTFTPTPGPRVPLAAIQVRAPGPMSKVVSPLQVQMLAIAGNSHKVNVNLFGEDGRLLAHSGDPVAGSPEGDPLSLKIRFEIRAAGEKGFVQVSTNDIHGRAQSLITVPILLLSSGVSQINPAGNTIYERIALSNPPAEATASGGVLQVEGEMLPYNRQPFILELITTEGRSVGLRVLTVSGSDWQSFTTTLPYKVEASTPARLFAHQADDVLNGPAYIYSQPITLNP